MESYWKSIAVHQYTKNGNKTDRKESVLALVGIDFVCYYSCFNGCDELYELPNGRRGASVVRKRVQ